MQKKSTSFGLEKQISGCSDNKEETDVVAVFAAPMMIKVGLTIEQLYLYLRSVVLS